MTTSTASLLREAVPVVALLALLAVAYAHPRRRVEAGVSVGAAALALSVGLLGTEEAWTAVRDLLAVAGFLAAILVVSQVCERAGLFAVAAAALTRGGAGPVRLFTGAFVLAAAVTAVLSLDATVVLLTPLVLAAARATRASPEPGTYACLRMANSASLLLPVSNLTNLLAMSSLSLTFAGFALTMAPVLAAVLVVEYAGLRLLFRRQLRPVAHAGAVPSSSPHSPAGPAQTDDARPAVPAAAVALMLAGFAVTSPLGVEPVWVAGVTAAALVGWAARHRLLGARGALEAAHLEFVLFVLALGVVVAAIATGFLGELVGELLPGSTDLRGLLVIALLATALANLVTNLSATLLLVPLVAPLGDAAVLAALLGLNIGSGLTLTGSLANLLWRRTLLRDGERPDLAGFHRVSLTLTPVSLLVAVGVLAVLT
ncbi:SLC13 family permease [Nocardioides nanhaiensis]|uniref:Arsenic transporter n=1 Tax=Nocardioides nanhaiensis TaxID=1476871 RepID=A0ABP8W2L3_9ACTN